MQDTQTKPNGPGAGGFLAAGVGSLVLGVTVVLNEVNDSISSFLRFDQNWGVGSGVGPLSGKAILATLAFAVTWVILHFVFRGKEVAFGRMLTISLVLVGLGFAMTFPPIFPPIAHLLPPAADPPARPARGGRGGRRRGRDPLCGPGARPSPAARVLPCRLRMRERRPRGASSPAGISRPPGRGPYTRREPVNTLARNPSDVQPALRPPN